MRLKSFWVILSLILLLNIMGCGSDGGTDTPSNEEKAIKVLTALETGETEYILAHVSGDTYIQHNLSVPDGRDSLLGAISAGMFDGTTVDVKRSFADGDFVVTHTDYNFNGVRMVGFDVFRFANGLIVEHWDNLQPYMPPNPSGRTMLDGPTVAGDIENTEANKALVADLIQTVFIGGDFNAIFGFFESDGAGDYNYIQHNPNIGDGLNALFAGVGGLQFLKNHFILGYGDFVLAMSEGRMNGVPVAFYDLFRVENGYIAEHWDTIEEIPAEWEWANTNGKFGDDVGLLNTEKATAILEGLESGDTHAIEYYIDPTTYIQHNLSVPDGRDSLLGAIGAGVFNGTTVDVIRSFSDGDYVVTHTDYFIFGARQVGFDVFRFEDGLIVEHWDNLQEHDGSANPAGYTMLDGPADVNMAEIANTAANKALVEAFASEVLVNGDTTNWDTYMESDGMGGYVYAQHNPSGLSAAMLKGFIEGAGGFFSNTSPYFVHGFGDFVLTMSDDPTNATAYFDLFRVEDGYIVEHWDVVQDIPPMEEWANANGKF